MGEVVVWLGIHDTCDLAFCIGNRSYHGVIGYHEQITIPSCFLDYHDIAVGLGPAPLEWVLSLHAGGGWVYNDGGVLTHNAKHFKRALHQHAQQVVLHLPMFLGTTKAFMLIHGPSSLQYM